MINPSKNILKMIPTYLKKSGSNMEELMRTGDVPILETEYGWMEFEIKGERAFVYSAYTENNNTKEIWDLFIKEIKKQGCKKVEMITRISPDLWKKLYNFNIEKWHLTCNLEGDSNENLHRS